MMNDLSDRAMLVHLAVHQWTGRVKDDKASKEVAASNFASAEAGTTVLVSLAPKKYTNAVDNAGWAARLEHQRLTMPWNDKGHRILPASMFMEYSDRIREKKAIFQTKVDEFLDIYPKLMESVERKQRLGSLCQTHIIPSVEELRHRFRIYTDILPIPTTRDFRVDLADGAVRDIKIEIERNIEAKLKAAQADLWKRLSKLVGHVHECLDDPDKRFRDSLMDNLKDFLVMIPNMNIIGDTDLEWMRQECIDKLAGLSPSDLRDDHAARKKAAKSTKDVLDLISDYF